MRRAEYLLVYRHVDDFSMADNSSHNLKYLIYEIIHKSNILSYDGIMKMINSVYIYQTIFYIKKHCMVPTSSDYYI